MVIDAINLNINRKSQFGIFLLFCFLQPFVGSLIAQQVLVEPMPLSNRLPSNSVQRIFQDSEGFVWLGTLDGLCRYDAYNMLVFRSGMNNSSLLTNNEITYITEDGGNRLFIGTKKGVNILDKETYCIVPMQHDEILEQEIRSILVDDDGHVWIGTLTWVYRFSPDLSSWKKFDHELPISSVNSIYQDDNGNVWVSLWEQGLHKYNPRENTFERQPRVGDKDNPFKLFHDNKGRYWLCTWGDGLFRFYPENNIEQMYVPVEIRSCGNRTDENRFFSISQDGKYEYIWLMSASGISVISVDDEDNVIEKDVAPAFSEFNNIFSELLSDKDGNIWIAAFGEGVLTVNMDKPVIMNYSIPSIKELTGFSTNIDAIYEDEEGDLWINQNRWGFGIFSPEKDEVYFYQDYTSLKDFPGIDFINCILGFNNYEVWLGPESEPYIYCLKKQNNVPVVSSVYDLRDVTANPGNPRLFFEDSNHNVWIATTTGLLVKPREKKEIQETGFFKNEISGITEDKDGHLWISTKNSGAYRITVTDDLKVKLSDIESFTYGAGGLVSNNIETICADAAGDVWMGSKEGHVFVYRSSDDYFEDLSDMFDMQEGGIQNITIDNVGHVWILTNKRIVEYNPDNQGIMIYLSNNESIVSSFTDNSLYNNRSGKLFFGGNKGISVFTPNTKLSEEPGNVRAIVTDLRINGNSVITQNENEHLRLKSQAVHLHSDDKNIEINFSSFNYTYSQKLQYAYKLQGVDDDWVYTDASRPFAFYNKLPKGKNTFLLKVTDINGLWSEEVTRVSIYKNPAFYESWWAYSIYFILAILLIYSIYLWIRYRIRLDQKLHIAQIEKEKSEELIQTKLRYFTNVSHDFLTPLTIISCLIDDIEITLRNKVPQFEIMRSNVDRLKRLLRQVLDFRKMESGNMKLKVSQNDIAQFIKELCSSNFELLMKKKGISFSLNADPEYIPAYFDADKIDKVIFNLLSNAVKYTPEYGEIKVELEKSVQDNRICAVIKVSDTGIGIAPEDLSNIFERFYTDKRGNSGESNGIGLSLTKELVTLHHGVIDVKSEINKGTVFTVVFPIDRKSYKDAEVGIPDQGVIFDRDINLMKEEHVPLTGVKLSDAERENTRLLLVEDNEELLSLMYQLLSKRYHVITAKNGAEALAAIKGNEINVIISDVMMPQMDGLDLCRILKSDIETSHIPVILLTAKNSSEDRIECYNAGADGYISKPFDLKVLEARINNFLLYKKSKQKEFRTDLTLNISTLGTSSIDEVFLDNTIRIIKENIAETNFDVNRLAEKLFVSHSSLYRKVKTMTGLSPVEFIRNIRLKHASHMLKEGACTVYEVAYASGFSNPKYFSTCFKEEFGVTPRDFQRQNG